MRATLEQVLVLLGQLWVEAEDAPCGISHLHLVSLLAAVPLLPVDLLSRKAHFSILGCQLFHFFVVLEVPDKAGLRD